MILFFLFLFFPPLLSIESKKMKRKYDESVVIVDCKEGNTHLKLFFELETMSIKLEFAYMSNYKM